MSERIPRRPSVSTDVGASWSPVAPSSDSFHPSTREPGQGLLLELLGGPLAGQSAFMRDSRWRLWLARRRSSLYTVGAIDTPAPPPGGVLLGCYAFTHQDEAYRWVAREAVR